MEASNIILDVERAARKAGVSVPQLCQRAEIHRSTWQRWKKGIDEPRARGWAKLHELKAEFIGGSA